MAVDRHLVLRVARTQNRHLVLGESESLETNREITVNYVFPDLVLAVDLDYEAPVITYDLEIDYTFPALTLDVEVTYAFDVPNYLTSTLSTPWSPAERLNDQHHAEPWREASRMGGYHSFPWHSGIPLWTYKSLPWHDASPVNPAGVDLPWHSAIKTNPDAVHLPWRDGVMRRRFTVLPWQDAKRAVRAVVLPWQQARRAIRPTHLPWRDGGRTVSYGGPPIVPEPPVEPIDPCYIPTRHLLLAEPHGDRHLVFVCELHPLGPTIVVPVKKVYKVLNEVFLKRVSDNLMIPTLSVSLALDWQSWTWSFSAQLPGAEYDTIKPDLDGTPVEVELSLNGQAFRFIVEQMATDRTFARKSLNISGRGKNAILDVPYAPILNFDNAAGPRTANQLMDDALMLNAVPIGWTVDFQLTDWLVPAGAWAHQGTHMSAVANIAQAAGGYVQPHNTDDTLIILPRYELLPADWDPLLADYELPAAVMQKEGMTWTEKPRYDRVFVSGTSQGIVGQVTITGEDGDIVAPTVTDPLITEAAAAEQRGRSILGDTGRINMVSLRLPVLEETGVLVPGLMVRYVEDAVTRVGIVRSVSVEIGFPEVWQTIVVETHE